MSVFIASCAILYQFLFIPSGIHVEPRFTVAGDSLTTAPEYLELMDIWGFEHYLYGEPLRSCSHVLDTYFYARNLQYRETNPYQNHSVAAYGGWTSQDLLNPESNWVDFCEGESPIACEVRLNNPTQAHILIGTNDPGYKDHYTFLQSTVILLKFGGVLPVLYTLPPHCCKDVGPFNANIWKLARQYRLPVIDYYSAMTLLPNQGLSEDGVHPILAGQQLHAALTLIAVDELR